MTAVRIRWDRPDRGGESGLVVFEPTRRYWRDDTRVTDAPVPVRVTAGQTATADLDPTGDTWCYAVTWTPDGDALPWTEYVLVPAGLEPVEYRDLQRLTRDAAQLLTGETAHTAATLLTRVEATADAVTAARTSASAAAEDAATASAAASSAAELSQASALSVLPMVAGAAAADTAGTTVTLDLGVAVNAVPALTTELDVILADVTTPDGRTNPDGLGTLLQVEAGADLLVWPGGTVVHGRPPEGAPAFASVVRVGGVVHVVWSVVDQTLPPLAGGGVGAAQAALADVLAGAVSVAPGGTVVTDGTDSGGWQFTNLSGATGTNLALTAGVVSSSIYSTGDDVRVDIAVTFGPAGDAYTQVAVSPLNPPMVIPPEGLGLILATRPPQDPTAPTPERDDAWADLYTGLGPAVLAVHEDPSGATPSAEWLALRMVPGGTGWSHLSEWGGVYEHRAAVSGPSVTWSRDVWERTADDFTALGITLPARLVPMSEIDARTGGGTRE